MSVRRALALVAGAVGLAFSLLLAPGMGAAQTTTTLPPTSTTSTTTVTTSTTSTTVPSTTTTAPATTTTAPAPLPGATPVEGADPAGASPGGRVPRGARRQVDEDDELSGDASDEARRPAPDAAPGLSAGPDLAGLLDALEDGERGPARTDDPTGRVMVGGLALSSAAALALGIRDRRQVLQD